MNTHSARRSYVPAADVVKSNRAGIRRRAVMRDRIETSELRAELRAYVYGGVA